MNWAFAVLEFEFERKIKRQKDLLDLLPYIFLSMPRPAKETCPPFIPQDSARVGLYGDDATAIRNKVFSVAEEKDMRVLEFGRSDRFLVPSVDLLKESTVVTRDTQYSLFQNIGQEKNDLFFAKWYDDSCEPTNFYDLVDNLMAYWNCITDEMYDKSQTWGNSFREREELKYFEGNYEFEALIDTRIPSLALSGYRNLFPRQVSGNYIPICRFMSMCENEGINAPKEIIRIWDIWLAGFFPCGFDGTWPESGKFIIFEPN